MFRFTQKTKLTLADASVVKGAHLARGRVWRAGMCTRIHARTRTRTRAHIHTHTQTRIRARTKTNMCRFVSSGTRTWSPCGADARAPCSEHTGSVMLIYCYSAPGDSAAMLAHARQHSGHAHTDLHRAVGEARGARDLGLPVVSAAREAHHQEHLV